MKITPSLFEAYLKCSTKCWLRANNESATGNPYAEWVGKQNEGYRLEAAKRLISRSEPEGTTSRDRTSEGDESQEFPDLLKSAQWNLAANVDLRVNEGKPPRSSRRKEAHASSPVISGEAVSTADQSLVTSAATSSGDAESPSPTIETCLHAVERIPATGRGKAARFVPIRFVYRNKLTKNDKLLLAFDAHVLSQSIRREIALGKIIHGDSDATLKVKTVALASDVRKKIEKINALLSDPAPPDLVLNRHCGECEFRDRCRKIAIEKDDLSLLANMSAKERQKFRSKGIFTVTQLSYTFRPRRRPKRMRDKKEKYHHSLKALAIREQKIHIVGSPELKIEGTPVYLDVEGLPDRDFYYLIGLRIGHGDTAVQHSLWADTVADEGKIWREFLAILETIEKPVLIHYGSYETTFLARMAQKFTSPTPNSTAAYAMANTVNVISVTFAQIYFPPLSNGLKDIAANLGYKLNEGISSGLESITWRHLWEKTSDKGAKRRLLSYNAQDCDVLNLVTQTTKELANCSKAVNASQNPSSNFVRADNPKLNDNLKWGDFKSSIPGFETVNIAAHWNYQRERIYFRSRQLPGRKRPKSVKMRGSGRVDQIVSWPAPRHCPICKYPIRSNGPTKTRTVQELIFGRSSLKRRLVKYVFRTYLCKRCRTLYGFDERFRIFMKFGWNLAAYFIFHIVEFNIPQRAATMTFNRLFKWTISRSTVNYIKSRMSGFYEESKQLILQSIVEGTLVHADETRANIKGTDGYVWVLTNMRSVVYFLADSRESEIIQKLLFGFKGVLVSDFYTAYDSIGGPQQRCLIHLVRDLNTEVLNNPFDEQLKEIVTSFASLLKTIIGTVDQRGLKTFFLKKHIKKVDRFYLNLGQSDYKGEAALKCKNRLEQNKTKLFTFLNHDGVPWNNNNAEHAIKAFARLRDVLEGTSTKKGLEEYLTLLSVCQTCKYMGVDFLDFLRSGEKDIHAFAESRRGRRRRTNSSSPA